MEYGGTGLCVKMTITALSRSNPGPRSVENGIPPGFDYW